MLLITSLVFISIASTAKAIGPYVLFANETRFDAFFYKTDLDFKNMEYIGEVDKGTRKLGRVLISYKEDGDIFYYDMLSSSVFGKYIISEKDYDTSRYNYDPELIGLGNKDIFHMYSSFMNMIVVFNFTSGLPKAKATPHGKVKTMLVDKKDLNKAYFIECDRNGQEIKYVDIAQNTTGECARENSKASKHVCIPKPVECFNILDSDNYGEQIVGVKGKDIFTSDGEKFSKVKTVSDTIDLFAVGRSNNFYYTTTTEKGKIFRYFYNSASSKFEEMEYQMDGRTAGLAVYEREMIRLNVL